MANRFFYTRKTRCLILFLLVNNLVSSQNAGDQFFAQWMHQIHVTFPYTHWKDSLILHENINDTASSQVYLRGDVVLDGVLYANCGIKYKGNSSNNIMSDKKSFKISFDKFVTDQKPDGLKKINLNNCFKDPTFLREKFVLDFMQAEGLHAPRCVYGELFINNQPYGLYTVVEEADDGPFLMNHFGNKSGNLFKGDPDGRLVWLGSNPTAYQNNYELHTNEDLNDWSDLIKLIQIINLEPSSTFVQALSQVLNIENYLAHRAANLMFVNLDSYDGSGHNYYIYNNLGRFEWIAWDLNEAFGNFKMGMSIPQLECLSIYYLPTPPGSRPLPERLFGLGNPYRSYYAYLLGQWLQKWPPARFNNWVDSMANVVRPYVYADYMKLYTNSNFENNLTTNTQLQGPGVPGPFTTPGLKSFYASRWNCIMNELSQLPYRNLPASSAHENLFLWPNPAQNQLWIMTYGPPNFTVRILTISGALLTEITCNQGSPIDISGLAEGMYFIQVKRNGDMKWETFKFIKINR